MSRRRNDHGFSLVEALAALAVFALAGVGVIHLQGQSLRTLRAVETRALAEIVVENLLTGAVASREAPPLGAREGALRLGEREWRWRVTVSATAEPLTRVVRADVFERDAATAAASSQAFVTVTP
ncbi:MAG: type II secretion system minor pseudopilin GspI [Hyphomonadaceae bacterium]|nr:type II secretion system minor pseudopilin GspI [Hyphomonadaceae bacterium]